MRGRRAVRAAAAATALVAILLGVLIGCLDTGPPSGGPAGERHGRTPTDRPPQPPTSELSLARSRFWVGQPEIVVGPAKYVDSYFTAVKVGKTVRGYVGNRHTFLLAGTSVADVVPTDERVIEAGDLVSGSP